MHGLRLTKTVDNEQIYYINDGDNVIAELYEDEVTAYYLRGLNLYGAFIGNDEYFYLYNAHGDVVNLTDTSGYIEHTYRYDVFGNEREPESSDNNPFRYCGEYYDGETGSYYLRARYYDPVIGRFTQQDSHWNNLNRIYGDLPLKTNIRGELWQPSVCVCVPQILAVTQSMNLYGYGVNNPVLYIDPTGDFVVSTLALVVGAGIITFGTLGGVVGNRIADISGAAGLEKIAYIAGGTIIGGVAGGAGGYYLAPAVIGATGAAGVSITTAGISSIAAAGTTFGKYGTLLSQNPNIAVDWSAYAKHGFERMAERGVTREMVDHWVKTGKVLQQGAEKLMYITKEGAVVMTKAGKLITTYSSEYFTPEFQEVVKSLFGE